MDQEILENYVQTFVHGDDCNLGGLLERSFRPLRLWQLNMLFITELIKVGILV